MNKLKHVQQRHLKSLEIIVYPKDGLNAFIVQQRGITDEGYTIIYQLATDEG